MRSSQYLSHIKDMNTLMRIQMLIEWGVKSVYSLRERAATKGSKTKQFTTSKYYLN